MTAKRDTSRQRRVNQNRMAREALVARRQAAAQKTTSDAEAAAEPAPTPRRSRGSSRAVTRASAAAAESSAGKASRAQASPVVPRRARSSAGGSAPQAATPAPLSAPDTPGVAGYLRWFRVQPGGLQMLIAFGLTLLATPFALLVPLPVTDENGKSTHSESLLSLRGAGAIIVLLIPILLAAIPLTMARHQRRRMARNVAAFLLGLWTLTSGLFPFYFLPVVAMAWGVLRASRAEAPGTGGPRWQRRPAPAATDDDDDADGAEVSDPESDRVSD